MCKLNDAVTSDDWESGCARWDTPAAPRQEQYQEPQGYPPRSYGSVTSPEGKYYKPQQRDDQGGGCPGNILNEWLLIKNTSVEIDWNEPYYTSDEGEESTR
eukprot:Skav221584  [mRNA]  locus=scaffold630:244457:245228:- [translate_table: standard]